MLITILISQFPGSRCPTVLPFPHLLFPDFRLHLNHPSPLLRLLCRAEMAMGAAVTLVTPRRANCKRHTSSCWVSQAGFSKQSPVQTWKIHGKIHVNGDLYTEIELEIDRNIWGLSDENFDLRNQNGCVINLCLKGK